MRRPHIPQPSPLASFAVSIAALAVALGGTAYATNGGTFLLGSQNFTTSQTTLTDSGSGNGLLLKTTGTAVPLNLTPATGKAPLATNSTVLVKNLNAALLNGKTDFDFESQVAANDTWVGEPPPAINASGALAGPYLFALTVSGSRSTADGPGVIGATLVACPGTVTTCTSQNPSSAVIGSAQVYSNETDSHRDAALVKVVELTQGDFTLGVEPADGMTLDDNDTSELSVTRLG